MYQVIMLITKLLLMGIMLNSSLATNTPSADTDQPMIITPDSIKNLVIQNEKALDKNNNPTSSNKSQVTHDVTPPNLKKNSQDLTKATVPNSNNVQSPVKQDNSTVNPAKEASTTKDKDTKKSTDKTDNEYILPVWDGSIMFSNEATRLVRSSIKEFEDKKNKQKEKHSFTGDAKSIDSLLDITDKPTVSPTFYLASIIYNKVDLWSFTLNKINVSSSKPEKLKHYIPELNLVSVLSQEIVFEWRTLFLNDLSPKWQDKLIIKEAGEFTSLDGNILINKDHKTVIFKLKINQTFDIYNMEIVEGYVSERPVKEENNNINSKNPVN